MILYVGGGEKKYLKMNGTGRHIQLVKYRFGKNQLSAEDTLAKQVYVIKSHPRVVPVDVNVEWLMQHGWNSSLDRLRYSHEQLFIRRFDPSSQQDFCVIVQMTPVVVAGNPGAGSGTLGSGETVQITAYGNDENMTELYFQHLFLGNHLDVLRDEMNVYSRSWVETPHDLLFFCGSVHAAFSLWGSMLVEMQLNAVDSPADVANSAGSTAAR